MKVSWSLLLLAAHSSVFGQQELADDRFRFYNTLGVFAPANIAGFSTSSGYLNTTGIRISRTQALDVYFETINGTYDVQNFQGRATLNIGSVGINAVLRDQKNQFFFGGGIGGTFGNGQVGAFGLTATTRTVFNLQAGYNISANFFGRIRHQFAPSVEGFQGTSFELGFRF